MLTIKKILEEEIDLLCAYMVENEILEEGKKQAIFDKTMLKKKKITASKNHGKQTEEHDGIKLYIKFYYSSRYKRSRRGSI